MRGMEPRCKSDVSRSIPNADEKDVKSVVEEKNESGGDAKSVEEHVFYEVYVVDDENTPDLLRKELHEALSTLSYDFLRLHNIAG